LAERSAEEVQMAESLASLEKRGKTGLPVQLEAGTNNDLLKALFHFLNQINELKVSESWTPPLEDASQRVIFKATLHGTCYTLLCSQAKPESKPEQNTLSPRELEIVRLASRGMSNKTIAAVLEISPWTVSTYIRRIFSKLNVNSRVEMVAIVTKSGFLESGNDRELQENPAVVEFEKLISHLIV
jgi:DNA-binding CsgD family transcriptional regulator